MKKLLLGSAALILTAGAATAADLPTKAPSYKAPITKAPVAVAYDWTGFYMGGYAGTSIGQSSMSTPGGASGSVDISKNGWAAGGTAGANWQFSPNWLIGVEGDLGYLANDRSFTEWNDASITAGVKTNWLGTLRGRFGYVTGPSLLYLTGGAAFLQLEDKFGGCVQAFCGPLVGPATAATTKATWTVGGGIETRLSRNWSTTSEYLYIDGGHSRFAANPYGALLGPQVASFSHQFHLIKTGLNYKFGGPAEPLPLLTGAMLPTDHDWSGLYVGGNLGGGLTTSRTTGIVRGSGENDLGGGGFAGGVQAGYNVMNLFGRSNWFAGLEGDIGALGTRAAHADWQDADFSTSQKTDWYGTIRGRIGTTTGPALLYGTGGAAFVGIRNVFIMDPALNPGQQITSATTGSVKAGWTIGGGTEVALDARWSAKLDYLYIDAGSDTQSVRFGRPGSPILTVSSDVAHRFHVIRAGLNYSLSAPVVAKY